MPPWPPKASVASTKMRMGLRYGAGKPAGPNPATRGSGAKLDDPWPRPTTAPPGRKIRTYSDLGPPAARGAPGSDPGRFWWAAPLRPTLASPGAAAPGPPAGPGSPENGPSRPNPHP